MDIFELQDLNRNASRRLFALYVGAVLATGLAFHALVVLFFTLLASWIGDADFWTVFPGSLSNPGILFYTAGFAYFVILLGATYKILRMRFTGGGRAVARAYKGREVAPGAQDPVERMLLNVAEEMSLSSEFPMPGVYILDHEPALNAFAAGFTPKDSVVMVTRGLLDTMKNKRDELQAIIGHEFSHLANGDSRLDTWFIGGLHGLLMVTVMGRVLLAMSAGFAGFGGAVAGGKRSKDDDGSGGLAILVLMLILALCLLATGLLAWCAGWTGYFFGRLLQSAHSRKREFLADAGAVQYTRNPVGFANALRTISGIGSRLQDRKAVAVSHMLFSNGFEFHNWFATHPPMEERIRAVEAG